MEKHISNNAKVAQHVAQINISNATNLKIKSKKKLKKALEKISIENDSLTKLITQKNTEIASLKRSSESLNELLTTIPMDNVSYGPAAANYKLIEISKENRKLNMELLTTRNQLSKKDQQIQKNQSDLQALEHKLKMNEKLDISKSNLAELKRHITDLTEVTTNLRMENSALTNKLEVALKCLQAETGHEWQLQEFETTPTNWHGRAEKIKHMEEEIAQYSDQLESYKQLLSIDTNRSKCGSHEFILEPTEPSEKLKIFQTENGALLSELEKQRSKYLNLRVKNEALSEEVIKCMTLVGSMEQRTIFNNENFTSLSELVVQQQHDYDTHVGQLNEQIANLNQQLDETVKQRQILSSKLNVVESMLSEKYSCIEKLLESNKRLEFDLKAFCGGFLFSCRDLRKEEFVAVLEALETEKEFLVNKLEIIEKDLNETNLKNERLMRQDKENQVKICNLECQYEYALLKLEASKKGHVKRVAKFAIGSARSNKEDEKPVGKIENEKLTQLVNELKVRLQIAETTIDDLKVRNELLTTEQEQQSKNHLEMVKKTKETILETIRKFRTA